MLIRQSFHSSVLFRVLLMILSGMSKGTFIIKIITKTRIFNIFFFFFYLILFSFLATHSHFEFTKRSIDDFGLFKHSILFQKLRQVKLFLANADFSPIRGIASEVFVMTCPTNREKTVCDRRIVTPAKINIQSYDTQILFTMRLRNPNSTYLNY